jgi:hypothetical protein
MPRLTKLIVETLKPDEHTDVLVWDSEIRGLGVRLKPSGTKTFFVQYRNHARRAASFSGNMVYLLSNRLVNWHVSV